LKTLQRILFGLGALLLLFVIFLAGSIAVDYLIGGNRLQEVTNTNIPGANSAPQVAAYVARPEGDGPFPVVIMIHEFYGLNESIIGKADGLAEAGYVVIAPDTFRGSTTAWIPRAISRLLLPAQIRSTRIWIRFMPGSPLNLISIQTGSACLDFVMAGELP
jgi:carboxymethylenebutenolidase